MPIIARYVPALVMYPFELASRQVRDILILLPEPLNIIESSRRELNQLS